MHARALVALGLLLSTAQAQEAQPSPSRLGALGLESFATRYGTTYETVYQLNLEPSATFRFEAFELRMLLPLSASATAPTYCCRTALGNATLGGAHRGESGMLQHWIAVSVSAPTSYWSDAHASSLAATAALTQDAGYYLPNTTTLRASAGAELAVSRSVRLGGAAGADYWLRHDQPANVLVVPLDASLRVSWGHGWSARANVRTLLRVVDPTDPRERFLHAVSAAIAQASAESRIELSLSMPLDESLRQLGMVSLGVAYDRSF